MSALLLRLAAPLQSWSGYRLQPNSDASTPTGQLPRKSAINGLIGAAIGSRALDEIGEQYGLCIRVERTNARTEDYQVLGSLPTRATELAIRHSRLAVASPREQADGNIRIRSGGNFPTTVTRKDYLSHSEFMVALETEDAGLAVAWAAAFRTPKFMTYLGRKSCAPSFPFVLGEWKGSVADLWSVLPHVDRDAERKLALSARHKDVAEFADAPLRTYRIDGDYDSHVISGPEVQRVPVVATRRDQLLWAKENLG